MKSEFSPEDLRKALLDWSAAARDALGTGDFDKARLAIAGLATFAHEVATEPAPAPQPLDYRALIDAAYSRHGYEQGTYKCVAFKHGAEWARGILSR